MRELLKEYPGSDAFQPLQHLAHVHMGPVRHQHVTLVACYFPDRIAISCSMAT